MWPFCAEAFKFSKSANMTPTNFSQEARYGYKKTHNFMLITFVIMILNKCSNVGTFVCEF
jgi:hypothetical protein